MVDIVTRYQSGCDTKLRRDEIWVLAIYIVWLHNHECGISKYIKSVIGRAYCLTNV